MYGYYGTILVPVIGFVAVMIRFLVSCEGTAGRNAPVTNTDKIGLFLDIPVAFRAETKINTLCVLLLQIILNCYC